MKMQIKEFAALAGVSVRTLHYYDEIGLLKPAQVDPQTGYRYYSGASLLRMQEILFYRELDFSLKSIGEILAAPNHDTRRALQEQKQLLTLKKERLEKLISAIDGAMKGENVMHAFDNSRLEAYKTEARERWGDTDAYKEYAQKTEGRTKEGWQAAADGMAGIFARFAACKNAGEEPDSPAAQALVKQLQQYITENFYTCTPQILAGLGQMYTADPRFAANIDQQGEGTAEFTARAIAAFCRG